MNQRLILIFKFDTKFIEPIKRKRQELEIQNGDINRTKSFINKSEDRYSIWRIEYKNSVSDSILKSHEGPNHNGQSLCELLQVKKISHYELLMERITENQDAIGEALSDNELLERSNINRDSYILSIFSLGNMQKCPYIMLKLQKSPPWY